MSKRQVKQTLLYDNRVLAVLLVCAVLPLYSAALDRRELRSLSYDEPQIAVVQRPDRASAAEAEAAKSAITNRAFELKSGYCSRFARQVVQSAQRSTKYEYLFGSSAKITANNFLNSPYGFYWPSQRAKLGGSIQPGDLLFKRYGSGGFGHVGVYAGNNLVAENSSTRYGRVQGAKGYRTLTQFGYFDVVGRLPAPTVKLLAQRAKGR